ICIDHASTQERNHQVRRMADIYSNAMRVACWLGPSSPNSASGMYVLLKLNEIWHKDLESTPESGIQFIRKYNAAARGHLSIIEREYWTRLWVVQEFLI
ncbi:heterokaryon incompatibility, partial [Leptodontidium sp. 2 PMI_412]